jgi:hypothetical protein
MGFYNNKGQNCGNIEDGWLVSHRDPSKHLLRNGRAWSFDADILDTARAAGARGVKVRCPGGVEYITSFEAFDQFAFDLDYPGHGHQRALPLRQWRSRARGQAALWDDLP